jgi:mono/diheme cytochrome c family protein
MRMIEEHNNTLAPDQPRWEVLLYKSRFLSTPDEAQTNGRFFIYVREGDTEKWIQFGIVTPGDPVRPINNLSIVSIGPQDNAGNRLTAIIDHWRTHEPDGSISLSTRYEKVGQTENCALCHKTSPLGIHPAEEYVLASDGRLVLNTTNPGEKPKKLNDRIETYGPPHFKDWMQVSDFGPTIGPAGRQRDMAFMRACTSRHMLSEASVANVQRSMRCSSCHNQDFIGPLNYPQSLKTTMTSRQLREYIVQGWMPPNNRLTSSEREALYSCLTQEYHDPTTQTGLLLDWLKGEAP